MSAFASNSPNASLLEGTQIPGRAPTPAQTGGPERRQGRSISLPAPYPLTARQMDLLCVIHAYQLSHGGVSPSFAEIRAAGFAQESISRLLRGLEERGWLRRLRNRARALQVLHAPPVSVSPAGRPLFFVAPRMVGDRHYFGEFG